MVQVCSESFECKVSAHRMWHGLFRDAHNCLPKAMPSKVASVEYPLGQLGFELPGAERIIKFHKGISDDLHKTKELLEKEEAVAKEEAEKLGGAVHEEALEEEKKAEEVVGAAEKEGGDVEEVVEKEARQVKEEVEKVGDAAQKEAHLIKEGVGGETHKGVDFIKEAVGGAAHGAAFITEKVVEKEAEIAHKLIDFGEKLTHKEAEEVGGALHKVSEFIKEEELWVKEKIEKVEHEAHKIVIHVVAGGLIGILLKHCKHTFELRDTSHEKAHGSILHWTSEFEAISEGLHFLHAFDKLKQHVLEPFHNVEAYLLKHDDYAC